MCQRPNAAMLDAALSLALAKDRAGIDAADTTQDVSLNLFLEMSAGSTQELFPAVDALPELAIGTTVYRPFLVAALALEQYGASQLPSEGQIGGLGPFPLLEAEGVKFNIRSASDRTAGVASLKQLQTQLDKAQCLTLPPGFEAENCPKNCAVEAANRRLPWSGQINNPVRY